MTYIKVYHFYFNSWQRMYGMIFLFILNPSPGTFVLFISENYYLGQILLDHSKTLFLRSCTRFISFVFLSSLHMHCLTLDIRVLNIFFSRLKIMSQESSCGHFKPKRMYWNAIFVLMHYYKKLQWNVDWKYIETTKNPNIVK